MLLDLIIPQYKEDDYIVKNLLDSINNQVNIDFNNIRITIINDKSDVLLTNKLFSNYQKLNINYLINDKNTGPGLARQYGIDRTDGKYIMFLDSDDILYNNNVLYIITGCINDANPDLLITNFVKEIKINNEIKYVLKKKEETYPWLHGKVFKREFLNNNDIRFNNNLRHLEDSYFWTCIMGMINDNNIIYLDFPSYLWKLNDNSITRKKNKYEYIVSCFNDYFNCPFYAYDYLNKHNSNIKNLYIIRAIFDIYIILNSNIFDFDELKDDKKMYLDKLLSFINNNMHIYKNYDLNKLKTKYDKEIINQKNKYNIDNVYKDINDFNNSFFK